ncbi:Retrovirus-related Pol polyprotein from transposon TNT 1-94 [Vitis vinifera]|uniref:Retrovirus-related Pol polyprotein from transposon TNT 1-94 n=1 Tax=Vitis vinifera TaxID=29760 RepID=A0A438K1G1_VITVI|nr:Retrovirus-related Pol polyprotein from transposon TNT 1-94 [Vitis vinifera]
MVGLPCYIYIENIVAARLYSVFFLIIVISLQLRGRRQIAEPQPRVRFEWEQWQRKQEKASGIEKFDGTDFAYWRMQIEDYLYGRKLHLPLLGTKPESMKAEEWALLDRQVLGVIRLTLSRSIAHNVVKEKTTADLMKALSGMYEKPSANNKLGGNEDGSKQFYGKGKLKYNDIRDLILAEEIRRRDAGETSGSGSALNLETRGRGNNRNSNQGRSNSRNSNRNRSKSRSGQQVQCWNCGKTEEVQDALLLAVDSPLDDWVLDSGASLGCCGSGRCPDIVAQWDMQYYLLVGTWKVTKGARVLARGKKTGTLYMTSCPRDTIAVADASTDTSLWHRRLGHMSEKGMKMLLSKGKLPELKSIDFDMCESCILGKQKRVSFLKNGRTPKAEKLELVHTDLWGPSPVASLGGSRYYITFIDDSSRKVWVYFLKNKSDVFVTFKKWKAMVETETGLKVKCLRSDNGGEYIDGGFSEYCAAQGIRMEKTIPGTPQQNGVAERMNRTLNERARSMRLHAGLPKTFWADAVSTAAYLINRGPSVPMEFRLPEEVWSGKEVKFSHLKVFGCVSYVHIDSDARSKLDAKSKICFFIGYGDEKFGYRFWDEQNRKIIRSRNVIFNEQVMYKDRSTVTSDVTEIDQKKSEFVNLDELTENMELTELPVGKKALHNKWVYRIKNEHDGSKRYKARLVVKGFQQKEGIDYTEIFSPVVKMSTIRLVLGMVAAENLHLEQLDVKTAFLHGDLEEDLYMIQPEGFIVQGQKNLVCKLRKSLYGLKQAPRQWYKKFDNFMHRIGFKRWSDIEKINNLKKQLSKQFAMKDLGAAKQILGMRIIRDKANGTLKLSQSEYVKKVLSRFNMNEAKPVSTPLGSHFKLSKEQSPKTEEERDHMSKVPYASAIGSLMYAMVCTRPDIAHAVGVVSRFMSRPGKQHWEAIKWILRYLKGSLDTCLCFTGASLKLQGYVDADFAGDIDSRKSTTGFVFTLGGIAISWASNLQKIVTLSTTEAEYVAATEAGKEMIWLHGFLDELGKKQEMGILHSDSQSAIFLAKNSAFHSKSKHIQTKYHFIRYLVEDKLVILEKICGSKNPADMLTKGVTIEKLKLCAASIGLLA